MLRQAHTLDLTEAGCDEAGRGCLAGPVVAAAVILPIDFTWKARIKLVFFKKNKDKYV